MKRTVVVISGLLVLGAALFTMRSQGPVRVEAPLPADIESSGPGTLVVDLKDGSTAADLRVVEQILGVELTWVDPVHTVDEALAWGHVSDLRRAVSQLATVASLEVAEPAIPYEIASYPNDPLFEKQWNLEAMGAPTAWRTTPRGAGVVVAVIDTGVAPVEDLAGSRLLKGASFVPGEPSSEDRNGHGTHVAGTIAQTTNNGIGVAGVAPEAMILPVKALSRTGSGDSAGIAAAIDFAVDEGADVINLSLGGSYSRVVHNAVKKARAAGVVVVAAAGNSGRRGVGYPAALPETLGVSALGPDGALAPYSSWGKGVDLAAPGGDKRREGGGILQNTVGSSSSGTYVEFQGTSMAAPHVAGAAALLLSAGVAPEQLEQTLLESTRGDGSWSPKLGFGALDVAAATRSRADNPWRFLLGLIGALLVAPLAQSRRVSFTAVAAFTAALTAGGLFILSWLPLPSWTILRLLSEGVLSWPSVLLGGGWMYFPLWLSAALPVGIGFTLGASRPTRAPALGFALGIGAHLMYGAAMGTLLPSTLGTLWLVANGTLCALVALALAGTEKLEQS